MAAHIDLIFDGQCGFCTRTAGWLRRLDRRGRISMYPLQDEGVLDRFGISRTAALAAVWAVEQQGKAEPVSVSADADSGPTTTESLDPPNGTEGCVHPDSGGHPDPAPARGDLRHHRGAAAINFALDAALGVRVFTALYRVPGVGWVQDHAYQWVADHRYLLRAVTPWCEAHPGDCGSRPSTH